MAYHVSIYVSVIGRFCIRHPSGHSHRKSFASMAYARKFCKRQGWEFRTRVA